MHMASCVHVPEKPIHTAGRVYKASLHVSKHVVFCECPGRMTAVGLLFGPVSHVWYGYLDRWMPLANISTVLKKVLVDQAVGGPVFLAYFFTSKTFIDIAG